MDSAAGKTITLTLGVCYDAGQDRIHIATHDHGGLITTVNADPASKRGHPNLFLKLAKCLAEAGAPHPRIPETDSPES